MGHKWCDLYCCWCNDVEEIVETTVCDMGCRNCDDCYLIGEGGKKTPIMEGGEER